MTLRVNNLTGFGGGGRGYSFALTDTDTTQNNTDSPSFSDLDAGNPVRGRILLAVITCHDDDADDDTFWPATCLIGGVTADKDVSMDEGAATPNTIGVAVYSAIVPDGATVTVSLTAAFSGVMDDWACALFRATGIEKTPVDIDGNEISDVELDTSAARFAVFGAVEQTGTNSSWSGGGNTAVAVNHGKMIIGYDDAPLGGATDSYTVDTSADVFAGAAYG